MRQSHSLMFGTLLPRALPILLLPGTLVAQQTEVLEFFSPAPTFADGFGTCVAIDGDVAVVGARGFTGSPSTVYFVDVATGALLSELVSPDAPDGLGAYSGSVDIGGGLVLAGSPNESSIGGINSGAANLYDATTGAFVRKVEPADGEQGDYFGAAVALDGDLALVGTLGHQPAPGSLGAAYLFQASTGAQLHKFVLLGQASGLGSSVALQGDVAVVGAPVEGAVGNRPGTVLQYDTGTGQLVRKITPPDGEDGDRFGSAVAIDGNRIAIGAPEHDLNGPDSDWGAVYVFDATSGQLVHKLVPDDGGAGHRFGDHLAMEGELLVVGATGLRVPNAAAGTGESSPGGGYLFSAVTGEQLAELRDSDPGNEQRLGIVAVSGDTVLMGAPGTQLTAASTFVFRATDYFQDYCGPAVPNSSGGSATLRGSGSGVALQDDLVLMASGLPANKLAMFLASPADGFVANPGGSQGNLCLGTPIARFNRPGELGASSAQGSIDLQVPLTDIPLLPSGSVAVMAGETWRFQCWFRDTNPASTSNFTDGLTVLF